MEQAMDVLLDYLDEIEDLLENSKSLPFTNKVSVEKGRLMDIIGEIRLNLPEDIRSAQRILGDHDRIVEDAKAEADDIIAEAENEAQVRVSNHEIFRMASEKATELMRTETQNANDLKLNALDYADEMLENAEKQMKEYITNLETQHQRIMAYYNEMVDVIYNNRRQLRGH